jgi:hypothetical protein
MTYPIVINTDNLTPEFLAWLKEIAETEAELIKAMAKV